ncbi:MAG: NAD(P)/FAD-dependent oxidoreductase [Candidatus Omnitrophica bacterium]|nr:NAD(P)/FAD-dependent oxidoreductase [Candidatus Omnitrophota bacterium]
MMSAIRASQLKQDVILIEKNSILGKKLLLSGKGRCNLTNACDLDSFLKRYSKNGQFLRDAFKRFFNQDLIRFFEERGLKLKVERQLRVFPESNRADSIVKVLEEELQKNKVNILYNTKMKDVIVENKEVKALCLENGKIISLDRLILATGGLSYSFTGSTGEGFKIVRRLGHRIVDLRPGLVPLEIKQDYPRLLEGLTLKNIRLKFSDGGKHIESNIGELLFTKFGISGPLVLSLSSKVVDWLRQDKKVFVEIDLKPALTMEQLDMRLLREFKLNSNKTIKNTLRALLPKRLIRVFLEIARINPQKKTHQITSSERKSLVSLFKGLRFDITRTRPIEEAMVTKGGVSLKEITPRTMESVLIKGLYFAGEMIDLDGDTGGFNLQLAFSTGYLAGEAAAFS